MRTSQPKKNTNSLLESISAFNLKNPPSEFEVKKLRREADKLKVISPSEGWMVEGTIASLVGDYSSVKKSFETALRYSSDEFEVIVSNYSMALKGVCKSEEALSVVEKYVSDESSFLLICCIEHSLENGLFRRADMYCKKLKELHDYVSPYTTHINTMVSNADELMITETESKAVHHAVISTLFNNKITKLEIVARKNVHSSCSQLLLFYADATADTIVSIELEIIDKLIELDITSADGQQKITPIILKAV